MLIVSCSLWSARRGAETALGRERRGRVAGDVKADDWWTCEETQSARRRRTAGERAIALSLGLNESQLGGDI